VPVQRGHSGEQMPGGLGRLPGGCGELGPGQPPQQAGVQAVDPAGWPVPGRDPAGPGWPPGRDQRAGRDQAGHPGVFRQPEQAEPAGEGLAPGGDRSGRECRRGQVSAEFEQ
jgi:hypothetical protein